MADEKYENWVKTVDHGVTDKSWDEYDKPIQSETDDYNRRLATTPHFVSLDWHIFKAMLWTESGGPTNAAWKTRPMQIGNPGDAGIDTLRRGLMSSPIVMSDQLKRDIQGNISEPKLNIRAGIAYAIVMLIGTDHETVSIDDPKSPAIQEYAIKAGDNFSTIAPRLGTTADSLKKLNPVVNPGRMQIGQKVKWRKASMQHIITGWTPLTTTTIAARYNVTGDKRYAEKLNYVLELLKKLKR